MGGVNEERDAFLVRSHELGSQGISSHNKAHEKQVHGIKNACESGGEVGDDGIFTNQLCEITSTYLHVGDVFADELTKEAVEVLEVPMKYSFGNSSFLCHCSASEPLDAFTKEDALRSS